MEDYRMSFVSDNFKMLSEIGECIARQFGEDCEVVLHDLTKSYDSTIVAIWNGHVTGRKIGDGGTDAGLAILRGTSQPKDEYCYINSTKDGHILRSTSKYFLDEEGKVVGSLCINYDITEFLHCSRIIEEFTAFPETEMEQKKKEFFANHVKENLEDIVLSVIQRSTIPVDLMAKEDKIELVRIFEERGVFLVKGAVEYVAEVLNVSRYTVYNYLDEIRHISS